MRRECVGGGGRGRVNESKRRLRAVQGRVGSQNRLVSGVLISEKIITKKYNYWYIAKRKEIGRYPWS
jgi:hypothetical protein